jgi:polysaccharide pyruvyl transferase WcaK-like protein
MLRNRLGVLGTYGDANLGDEAIFVAFLQWVARHTPHVQPVALTANPAYIEKIYGVPAFPLAAAHAARMRVAQAEAEAHARRATEDGVAKLIVLPAPRTLSFRAALKRCFPATWRRARAVVEFAQEMPGVVRHFRAQVKLVRSLDGVLVLGGGQIFDFWDGPTGHPLTLFLWAAACRLLRKPFVVMSVGAIPLRYRSSEWCVRTALRWSTYVSFRDLDSMRIARRLGFDRGAWLTPDLALGLSLDGGGRVHRQPAVPARGAPLVKVVGVSPMAFHHPLVWPRADAAKYARYLDTLGGFCNRLARSGHRIVLFASQVRADVMAIDDLLARLSDETRAAVRVACVSGVPELVRVLGETDAVVASRFHGLLLALWCARPALSLSYQPKCDRLLESFQAGRFALDAQKTSAAELWRRYCELLEDYERYQDSLGLQLVRVRHQIDAQYRDVFTQCGWADAATLPVVELGPLPTQA